MVSRVGWGGGKERKKERRTCANSSDDSADEMRMEDVKGIIDLAHEGETTEPIQRYPRHSAGAETEKNCAPTGDHTSCGGDGDKTCNHTLHGTDDGRFLEKDDIHDCPCKERDGGAEIGVEHGDTGIRAGCVWISSVETVPSCPEDTRSDEHEGDVAWFRVYAIAV